MAGQRVPSWMLWLVIPAAPVALAFETLVRLTAFPDDFELVREFLRPQLTPVAWVVAGVTGALAMLGLAMQRKISQRRLAGMADASIDERYTALYAVFFLTSSVPQLPTILATFGFTFGASIWPVLIAIALCSAGIIAQALQVRRLIEPSKAEVP